MNMHMHMYSPTTTQNIWEMIWAQMTYIVQLIERLTYKMLLIGRQNTYISPFVLSSFPVIINSLTDSDRLLLVIEHVGSISEPRPF